MAQNLAHPLHLNLKQLLSRSTRRSAMVSLRRALTPRGKYTFMRTQEFLNMLPAVDGRPAIKKAPFQKVAEQTPEVKMYDPMYKALKPFVGGTWHMKNTSKYRDADLRSTYFDQLVSPDGALYPQPLPDGIPICSARHMASYFEFKTDPTHDPFSTHRSGQDSIENDTAISEYRTRIFAIFIIKDKCRLLCHTRTGTLVTQKFSYINTPFLQEFIWRLTRATPSDVGYDETFMPILENDDLAVHVPEAREYLHASRDDTLFRVAVDTVKSTSDPSDMNISAPFVYDPKADRVDSDDGDAGALDADELDTDTSEPPQQAERTWYIVCKPFTFAHHLPVGRGTQCFMAYDVQRKCVVLLKDQWRVALYTAEGKVYVRLRRRKARHILRIIAHGDVLGQRCGHEVPDVISGAIRRELVHTRVVLDAVGKALHHFASTWELVGAMRDVLVAHRDAFQNAQVLHSDMSEGNWIIVNGRGYLIDWELSKLLASTQPRVAERTGTWQFMPIRLLNDSSVHEVRDDLEAAIWVLFWTLIKYAANKFTPSDRLKRLEMFEYHPNNPSFGKRDFATFTAGKTAAALGVKEPPQLVELTNKLGFAIAVNNDYETSSEHSLETHDWILTTLNSALEDSDWKQLNDSARENDIGKPVVEVEDSGSRKRKVMELPMDAREEHKKQRLCYEGDDLDEEEEEGEEIDESNVLEHPDYGELGL
ncbi:hypothetical protein DL96DRAFT_1603889 [Flagelloscypha sp. PMI_526]|nr:hypothetical protein DL96DRAFT_1603889 [Flagelloscypha sp. PMI_526]